MIVTFTPTALGSLDHLDGISGSGTIVGGESALQFADEDTGYVEISGPSQATSFVLVPDKPTPPFEKLIRVWWAAQFRLLGPPAFPTADDYVSVFLGENIAGNFDTENPPTHSTEWVTVETTSFPKGYDVFTDQLYPAWAFDPTLVSAVTAAHPIRISWLRYYAEFPGAKPLRWRQRNDGLGVGGPGAARGRSSVQMSNRGRGYV